MLRVFALLSSLTLLACSGASDATTDPEETGANDGAPSEIASDGDATSDGAFDDTTASDGDAVDDGATLPPIEGYWVWKELVEDGKVTRTITDEDMTWKVGPSGWPGCPSGISCTKYGIDVLYVGATRFHHMHRVTTGSDSQKYGSYTRTAEVLTLAQEQTFSCAHPKDPSTYPKPATLIARYKRVGEDLWMTPFSSSDPGATASKWTVYRAIGKADAHNKYDHPFCGEAREGGKCHCLCPSQDVLADWTCAKK